MYLKRIKNYASSKLKKVTKIIINNNNLLTKIKF